eukprot:g182.t1
MAPALKVQKKSNKPSFSAAAAAGAEKSLKKRLPSADESLATARSFNRFTYLLMNLVGLQVDVVVKNKFNNNLSQYPELDTDKKIQQITWTGIFQTINLQSFRDILPLDNNASATPPQGTQGQDAKRKRKQNKTRKHGSKNSNGNGQQSDTNHGI